LHHLIFQPAADNYLSEVFKFLRRAMEEDGTVASIISFKALSSEMDPAEIRLIR
jgi:hypothetical protein